MNTSTTLPGTVLIAGSAGQLARAFAARFEAGAQAYAAPPESELDITDRDAVAHVLDVVRPSVLINCAAYNAVDLAESEEDKAYRINSEAVGILAEQCAAANCRFVHYSSDYVFDGKATALYTEQDATAPLNVYGRSKLEGERQALAHEQALVLRVSWVFGDGEQNFLYKLRQWAKANASVSITADETSVPSYTEDIVTLTLAALDGGVTGLFHANNSGYASRYEWAKLFLARVAPEVLVVPVALAEFPSPAERPHFAAMSNEALSKAMSVEIPDWRDAVERYMETL